MRALGRTIGFRVTMCSSRVLLGLKLSARARSRNRILRADVFNLSPVRGCKYERYVRYISTYEHICLNLKQMILLVCLMPRLNIQSLVHPLLVWLRGIIMGERYSMFQIIRTSCTRIKFISLVFPLPKRVIRKIFMLIYFQKY